MSSHDQEGSQAMIKPNTRDKLRKVRFLGVVFFAVSIMACSCPISQFEKVFRGKPNENESWQDVVDEIKALTRGLPVPNDLGDPDAPVTVGNFDPNRLLKPLDHLELQEGMVLDYVYWYDGMGGLPVLYAREEGTSSFESYQAYKAATSEDESSSNYLDYIVGDDSEEGYFQWVVLQMMGDQFYLFWHANYNDAEIIASKERLEEVVDEISETDFGYTLSDSQKQEALRLDPAPEVEIMDDKVTVRVLWFTKWGGFYETIYTLTASAPYQIIDTQNEQLLPYECGVMF